MWVCTLWGPWFERFVTENYRNFYKSSDLLNLKSELYVYRLGLSYAVLIKLKYIVVKELNID